MCFLARRAHRYTCCDEANRRSQALRRGAGVTETRLAPRTRQLIISLIVACAMFMQNLDSTIIATALPAIGQSIGESPLRLNVAITCYLLSLAVFIPISGWTADRFGARRVFSAAIVVFTLGSIGCGLSHSLWMLVIARIVQGMGGAMMVPVGRLVLLKTVPRSELVRAMSYVSVPALVGPVIGPPLGGFIVIGVGTGAMMLYLMLNVHHTLCWCASSSTTFARPSCGLSTCAALS